MIWASTSVPYKLVQSSLFPSTCTTAGYSRVLLTIIIPTLCSRDQRDDVSLPPVAIEQC